jgi:hypothetical protein
MTRVIVGKDCGNSPKNLFLQQLTIAFATGDTGFILRSVAEEIRWNIVGQRLVQGKADFAQALVEITPAQVAELAIHHVVTHGKAGAVNGTLRMDNGKCLAFCDVYEFSGASGRKVRGITSYALELR